MKKFFFLSFAFLCMFSITHAADYKIVDPTSPDYSSPTQEDSFTASLSERHSVINIITGKTERTFSGHQTGVLSFDISRNDRFLASGSAGGVVKIWDLSNGNLYNDLTGVSLNIGAMDITKDGKYLAYTVNDESAGAGIALFNLDDGILYRFIKPDIININSLKFSNAGDKLAIGGSGFMGKSFYIYDIGIDKLTRWKTSSAKASLIEYSPGDKMIAHAIEDTIKVQDAASGVMKKFLTTEDGSSINSIKFSVSGDMVCCGSSSGGILLYNFKSGDLSKYDSKKRKKVISPECLIFTG